MDQIRAFSASLPINQAREEQARAQILSFPAVSFPILEVAKPIPSQMVYGRVNCMLV
jgi:hypothetical protein